jgi:hypothetical protein
MDITIYRILNLGAKDWPPHADDRRAQQCSIRNALHTLRLARACEGGHVHIGAYGVSVIYTHPGYGGCRLSGYGLRHCSTALAAMVAGVPWVDTRPVTDLGALLRAPMVACGWPADRPPWHGMSYAPRAAVFAYYRRHGAITGAEPKPLAELDENDYLQLHRSTA